MNLNINIFYTTCGSAKQSKKLAKAEFSKLGKKTQEKILDCLQADIRARSKQLKNDNFSNSQMPQILIHDVKVIS